MLVTLSVLPAMAHFERRYEANCRGRPSFGRMTAYNTLPGVVWEVVITGGSTTVAHLREDIVRHAWLLATRGKPPTANPIADDDANTSCWNQISGHGTTASIADRVASDVTISNLFDRHSYDGLLTRRGRQVLESIAAANPYSRGNPSRALSRYRLRVVTPLRGVPAVRDALTA